MTLPMQPQEHWSRNLTYVALRRRNDIDVRMMDGEAVLYDAVTGCTHRLNESALAVWRACDGRTTTLHLAEQLTARYDVSLEQAQLDVEQLLAAMARAGLLEAGDSR